MKVLLIDDSRCMREIVRSVLVQLGDVRIVEADGGRAGLELARAERPDLVLVDGVMPDIDGLSFVRGMRQFDDQTPVIVMLSGHDRESVIEAVKAGASTCLVKPFTPDLLSQRVQEALAGTLASGLQATS
ncbi:MAG: response regulator [Phycisphaerales bacterium JB060]